MMTIPTPHTKAIAAPMARRPPRRPIYRTTDDRSGDPIVCVPLPDGTREAVCDAADYDALAARGLVSGWTYNSAGRRGYGHGYVRCRCTRLGRSLETVARLIVDVGSGYMIRYRDGNPLNLRRHNLRHVSRSRRKRGKA